MSLRVGVFGAGGKMGAEVCRAVIAEAGLDLVAAIDPGVAGESIGEVANVSSRLTIAADGAAMLEAAVDVAVDFTHLDAARKNLPFCAENGIHAVVGTTGFSDDDLAAYRQAFTRSNALIVPNFAIGAVLMMRFAELAAPHFDTAEIIEFHHNNKADAPSGTAMATAARMTAASDAWAADPTRHEVAKGARGGDADGIRLHAVRMVGMVAHQEVLLGTTGQTISIRHDSYDRTSFMPGVVLSIRGVADLDGVTLGLEPLLGL